MDTLRLTLLRHGQAQPIDSCPEDFERVLTRHGSAQAEEMATRLVQRGLVPDLLLVSPAERAWNTAAILATSCDLVPDQVQLVRELYLATPATLWRVLKARATGTARHVLICGHNPGLSELASHLGPHPKALDLPTAGLATALWLKSKWDAIEPETAHHCRLDDPESPADLWS